MSFFTSVLLIFVLLLSDCGPLGPESKETETISATELASTHGFKIPLQQDTGDQLPPQPGRKVQGHTVKGGPNSDTNWTAFTMVLVKAGPRKYRVLTQKRGINPVGVIETAGGHLVGGQTWRDGAREELEQEAGIKVKTRDLIFLEGAKPKVSMKGSKLFGNANFFIVFDKEPITTNTSNEVDRTYGHQWKNLKDIYVEALAEQGAKKFAHGKYYSFFRRHILTFCKDVIDCASLN